MSYRLRQSNFHLFYPQPYASDTRIGLMDSTVPIEALVNEETYPR
ncbi:MAG: hypothetical protein PUB29_06415 [Bacteroidales bacterium]|nr:hypothetical protein [Bacteroidales bacterium]